MKLNGMGAIEMPLDEESATKALLNLVFDEREALAIVPSLLHGQFETGIRVQSSTSIRVIGNKLISPGKLC